MFDAIVSSIANVVRKTLRAVESVVRREPVIATATALLVLLLFVF